MIPHTFDQWRDCIVNDCKIEFTSAFIQKRLAIYQDPNNTETKKFKELYGEQHLQNVIRWLNQAA